MPKTVKIGNDHYLNNNSTNKHDIQNGLIHSKLREDAIPYIELLQQDPTYAIQDAKLQGMVHRIENIKSELNEDANSILMLNIKSIVETFAAFKNKDYNDFVGPTIHTKVTIDK